MSHWVDFLPTMHLWGHFKKIFLTHFFLQTLGSGDKRVVMFKENYLLSLYVPLPALPETPAWNKRRIQMCLMRGVFKCASVPSSHISILGRSHSGQYRDNSNYTAPTLNTIVAWPSTAQHCTVLHNPVQHYPPLHATVLQGFVMLGGWSCPAVGNKQVQSRPPPPSRHRSWSWEKGGWEASSPPRPPRPPSPPVVASMVSLQ